MVPGLSEVFNESPQVHENQKNGGVLQSYLRRFVNPEVV